MRALLILVILISGFAHAKSNTADGIDKSADLENTLKAVGSLSYRDARQGLIDEGGRGPEAEQMIADLNTAFTALKNSGQNNPSVKAVVDKYRETHELPQTALIGTICVVAIVAGVYGVGHAIVRSNPKLQQAVETATRASAGPGCQASRVIESAHLKKEAAVATGNSAT